MDTNLAVDGNNLFSAPASLAVKYILRRLNPDLRGLALRRIRALPSSIRSLWYRLGKDYGLPYGWSRLSNSIFAVIVTYALVSALATGVYFPSSEKSIGRTRWRRLFTLYLYLHAVLYVVELLFTRTYRLHAYLAHHIISIILFLHLARNSALYSVLLFMPFYAHCLAWVINDAESDGLLMIYNLLNVICIALLILYPLSKHPTSFAYRVYPLELVPTAVITPTLVYTNVWAYCSLYSQSRCLNSAGEHVLGLNEFTGALAICASLTILSATAIFFTCKRFFIPWGSGISVCKKPNFGRLKGVAQQQGIAQ